MSPRSTSMGNGVGEEPGGAVLAPPPPPPLLPPALPEVALGRVLAPAEGAEMAAPEAVFAELAVVAALVIVVVAVAVEAVDVEMEALAAPGFFVTSHPFAAAEAAAAAVEEDEE